MTLTALVPEFSTEMRSTRRLMACILPDRLDWRPHPKSFTAGGLAGHLVDCVRWVEAIVAHDTFDIDPATYQTCQASSLPALLAAFDEEVSRAEGLLAEAAPSVAAATWRLSVRGTPRVERPRGEALRDFTLHHVIHHRGQLSVYLRLMDVPVPGVYGSTADDVRSLVSHRSATDPRGHETGYSVRRRWHRGRLLIGAGSPFSSWTRSPASTLYCDPGGTGERTP